MIKLLIASALLLAATVPAAAGVTCQTINNITYCSDGSGKSITCQRINNITYCN